MQQPLNSRCTSPTAPLKQVLLCVRASVVPRRTLFHQTPLDHHESPHPGSSHHPTASYCAQANRRLQLLSNGVLSRTAVTQQTCSLTLSQPGGTLLTTHTHTHSVQTVVTVASEQLSVSVPSARS